MGFNVGRKVRNLKESPVRLGRINFADFSSLDVLNSEHLNPVTCAPGECYRTRGGGGGGGGQEAWFEYTDPSHPKSVFPHIP